jgi:hypothetical protein
MTDTELLNQYIENSGLKVAYIAKQIGRSRYNFTQKRDNKSEFLPSEIEKLCELLKINSLEEKNRIFFATNVSYNSTKGGEHGAGE